MPRFIRTGGICFRRRIGTNGTPLLPSVFSAVPVGPPTSLAVRLAVEEDTR
jgi:hypothetical protein